VVKGDGDIAWGAALADCRDGSVRKIYEGGKVEAESFKAARWDLLPKNRYMWASVQTVRRLPQALLVLLCVAYRWATAAAA
jgi:hypothetical protein